jgi:hypothetical protein
MISKENEYISDKKYKTLRELELLCKKFIQDQKICSEETIYQMDRVVEHSLGLINDICDILGYHVDF